MRDECQVALKVKGPAPPMALRQVASYRQTGGLAAYASSRWLQHVLTRRDSAQIRNVRRYGRSKTANVSHTRQQQTAALQQLRASTAIEQRCSR
jgi:alkylated DNA nucleotide flippase Atl1